MTIRRNRITGDPLLLAPERAERPGAFGGTDTGRCPFCPGNEADTPPTLAAIGDPWHVRAFANKYPPAVGAEVIVEAREHDATFDVLDHAVDCLQMYRDRLAAHAGAPYVALFRNDGVAAGSSIPHIHSQLVPLPFVPPRAAREIAAFNAAAVCPLCTAQQGAVIHETAAFRWIAPDDSWMPYQQRIVPKRHVQTLGDLDDAELRELATILRDAARTTRRITASFNWTFHGFAGTPAAHLYVDILPRLTTIAGLELATGTFVEIIDPDVAAVRLRDLNDSATRP